MKSIQWLGAVAALLLLTGCIKDEPLNAEADIVSATLPGDVLARQVYIGNDYVSMYVKHTDMTCLAPEFELSPGATIEPPSGTVRDFTVPQQYLVISQDGQWSKSYEVRITDIIGPDPGPDPEAGSIKYGFENVDLVNGGAAPKEWSYDVFYEGANPDDRTLTWASGNPGFAITGRGSTPETFPTYQINDGHTGKALGLTTRLTGSFGAMVNKPIAAGNLFLGEFDMTNAISKPLEATRFGIPFGKIPTYLRGWYKYTPGPVYYVLDETVKPSKLREIPGKVDEFNLYGILYEVTPDMPTLDGRNVLSEDNPNIVATAIIPKEMRVLTEEWTEFDIPFTYRDGKEVDLLKLADGGYNIAIVFSSSIDGDYFCGAPESTLLVDEVELGYVK